MLTFLNDYIDNYAASVYLSFENDNLNVAFNCKAEFVQNALKKPVAKDDLELGLSQAVLNLLTPWSLFFEWKHLLGLIFHFGGPGSLRTME